MATTKIWDVSAHVSKLLAYKEELMRKKREKERNAQNASDIANTEIKNTETKTEEEI